MTLHDEQIRVQTAMNHSLSGLKEDPWLSQRILANVKGEITVKRKLSTATFFVFALLCVSLTGAFAAVLNAVGILDFAASFPDAYVPENAADAIKRENRRIETENLVCTIEESFYDGKELYLTARIEPKNDVLLVFGAESPDCSVRDLNPAFEEGKTIGEYAQERYNGRIANIAIDGAAEGSSRFLLNEDGSATLYTEFQYEEEQVERNVTLNLIYIPLTDAADAAEKSVNGDEPIYNFDAMEKTDIPLNVTAVGIQSFVSNEVLCFPTIGVRITGVKMDATPFELRYELQYTVTDAAKYEAQEDGIWFEFIDPDSASTEYSGQRVSAGVSGSSEISRLNSDSDTPVTVGTMFRQTGSIGLNAQSDHYTIRAYNCWNKTRYETVRFDVI